MGSVHYLKKNSTMDAVSGTSRPSLPRINEKRLQNHAQSRNHFVIGVDEAGRGPLAGPVVAASFTILKNGNNSMPPLPVNLTKGVTDSKQVNEEEREWVYNNNIKGNTGIRYKVSVVDNKVIDRINILQATFQAMSESALNLIDEIKSTVPDATFSIIIDGNKIPPKLAESEHHSEFLIKGDSIEFVIAAASICAKVERDKIMYALNREFPMYGFGQHKGYPTGSHVAAVHTHGPCRYHRMTFAPLKHMKKKPVSTGKKTSNEKENLVKEQNKSKSADCKRKDPSVMAEVVDAREERLRRRNNLRNISNYSR